MKWSGFTACFMLIGLMGCQTTGISQLYDKDTIVSKPTRSQFSSEVEYVANFTVYQYPRRCKFFRTSDGMRAGENKTPSKFTFLQIIKNKYDDGWYMATVQPQDAVFNALSFYVNARVCGQLT